MDQKHHVSIKQLKFKFSSFSSFKLHLEFFLCDPQEDIQSFGVSTDVDYDMIKSCL